MDSRLRGNDNTSLAMTDGGAARLSRKEAISDGVPLVRCLALKKPLDKRTSGGKVQPVVALVGGSEYGRLLTEIKERVRSAQYEALRAVNIRDIRTIGARNWRDS